MTAFLIADIKVTDDKWIPAYAASVHDLVHKHGGKYLARSGNVKTLEGKPLARTAPLFWEHEGNRAMRDGKWKLVSKHSGGWELYDMETDRTELSDLSKGEPERAKAMIAQWDAWATRVGVEPWPVAKKNPKKP